MAYVLSDPLLKQLELAPEIESLGVFKANRDAPFHRWVHLTEGFSAKLVAQELRRRPEARYICDPFGGTGTTPLVAAEMGREGAWAEVNPYLQQAAKTKVAAARAGLRERQDVASVLLTLLRDGPAATDDGPPLVAANESRDFFAPEALRDLLGWLRRFESATGLARQVGLLAVATSAIQSSNMIRAVDLRHRLSYGDLLLYMFANLGRPASWPQIAAGLEQAATGDGSAIETALQQTRPLYRSALNSATALQCADKPPPQLGPQAWPSIIGHLTRVSPFLAVTGWWLAVPCAGWPLVNADRYSGPWNASTRNPILVIGTRHDPQTAYAGARRVARLLGNAKLLTLDGYGHTTDVDPSTCIDHALSAYLIRPATARRQTCHADRQPFDPDFGTPLPNPPIE